MDEDYPHITQLPNEIISIILAHVAYRDVVNLGATCKHFNSVINSNQYLWKEIFKNTLPTEMYNVSQQHGAGNWLHEFKKYFIVKNLVYEELSMMSPMYYWRVNPIEAADLSRFFSLALGDSQNFYYVLTVLQDIVRKGNNLMEKNSYVKSYTLTDLYYAKITLQYLTHIYLTIKWVQGRMRNEWPPEAVLNFFVQWADTSTMHSDKDVQDALMELVEEVEQKFPIEESQPVLTVAERIAKRLLDEKDVLVAISDVIYNKRHLAVLPSANIDALIIVKAIKNKCGNAITAATVYQAVARRCGIYCNLVTFPNHLFLEWQNPSEPTNLYKVELESGALIPKGRCPFSRLPVNNEYKYCPDSLMHYISSAFLMTMGSLKNQATQNALYLLDFLNANPNEDNPYRNFLPYLIDTNRAAALNITLQLEYLNREHREIMDTLYTMNLPQQSKFCRKVTVQRRNNVIKYAVGMICYHRKYDYLCVIRGWELTCSSEWRHVRFDTKTLRHGSEQPFYWVIAVDQSERYVAQENMVQVAHPSRLYHLEDAIAKEFSHFNGKCYVPNEEKEKEYPDDGPIRDFYKTLIEQTTSASPSDDDDEDC